MVNFSKAFTADQIQILNEVFQKHPDSKINPVMKLIGSTNWGKVHAYKASRLWADWESETPIEAINDVHALLLSAKSRIGPIVIQGERIMAQAKDYLHTIEQIESELNANQLTDGLLDRLEQAESELSQTRGELKRARDLLDRESETMRNRIRNQETHGEATR